MSCQDQVNETWDFLETAAIIANCDLIITSDTAIAHLAGGMGKATWLLLQKVPEWRWGLEGETTFWYPSMRLFRQRERGNWDEVMVRVAVALQEHFGGSSTPAEPAPAPQPAGKNNRSNRLPWLHYWLPNPGQSLKKQDPPGVFDLKARFTKWWMP